VVEEVIWSVEADEEFKKIINYLRDNWSEQEVEKFINATARTIEYIVEYPRMFRETKRRNVHEVLVTPQNLLLYHVSGTRIQIVTIWDTRQNPRRKKYKTK
jgi:plasmid stabilization system protein ParE